MSNKNSEEIPKDKELLNVEILNIILKNVSFLHEKLDSKFIELINYCSGNNPGAEKKDLR